MRFNESSFWCPARDRTMKLSLVSSMILLACLSSTVLGDCPPGSKPVRVERVGDEEHTYCKCAEGYVAREGQCVLKMPTVDPAFFVSSDHAAFISDELQRLRERKGRLEKQLNNLNQLREEQDGYLQQMGEMRQQLIYDCVGDVLAVISTGELLARIPGLSLKSAEALSRTLKAFKVAVDSMAAAESGPDKQRAFEKTMDTRATTLSVIASMAAPAKEKEALSKFVESSYEVIKATQPDQYKEDKPLVERVAKALDGVAAITGALYWPLGVARSSVHATGAGIVLWRIQHDKESLVETLVSSQRAKLAADQRLAATNERIKFYEIEMKKSGK